eukprot:1868949-Pleurochrysis_carterae.AAC.1
MDTQYEACPQCMQVNSRQHACLSEVGNVRPKLSTASFDFNMHPSIGVLCNLPVFRHLYNCYGT